jgi:hypothetical protein
LATEPDLAVVAEAEQELSAGPGWHGWVPSCFRLSPALHLSVDREQTQ